MTRQSAPLIGLAALVSFLLGLVAAGTRPPLSPRAAVLHPPVERPLALAPATAPDVALPEPAAGVDFASVAARLNAAVVNVDTASRGDERRRPSRRYSTDDPSAPHEGSGSGFIIDPTGFILTNDHVVSDADRVTVTLADGRAFRADVVGTDPAIDVALLKIESRGALPVAPIGDSDSLRVGEWVCAIGNPLGVYVHSVTVGVVSFLGRKLFDQSLDAFIQTDAAISFGSSGGPLINARGEVVGITTAISAQAMNIGFAIPMAQVTGILPQLRERGSVARGYLDVGLTNLTPALRRALDVGPAHGALIQDIGANTPADHAGLRPYDLVTAVDGHDVRSDEEMSRYLAGQAPGTMVTLRVWRDGVVQHVPIKLALRAVAVRGRRQAPRAGDARPVSRDEAPLGLKVRTLDPETAVDLRIPDTVQGVLVAEVDTAGPAQLAQLRPSNVILEINRHPVRSEVEYRSLVSNLRPGDPVALLVFDRAAAGRVIRTVVADPEP
jgi:serine protease Do